MTRIPRINLSAEDYKARFMLLREWQQKTDPFEAVTKINQKFGDKTVTKSQVNKWYSNFNNGDKEIISENSSICVTSTQHGESKNLLDSILLITDEKCFSEKLLTKDGRFLILPYCDKESKQFYIGVYDLFSGNKRMTPVSFGGVNTKFEIAGDCLLALDNCMCIGTLKIYIIKINRDDLSVKELKLIDLPVLSYEICVDQLNEKIFTLFNEYTLTLIKIQNDKGVLESIKTVKIFGLIGKRLIGNKIQCFDFGKNVVKSMKFCELDLNTMKMKKINVPIKFGDVQNSNNFILSFKCTFAYCWAGNRFYGMFRRENFKCQLISFNVGTLEWYDVKIFKSQPTRFFIGDNGILTFCAKNIKECSAVYRITLRKPDTLLNLTRFTAVKEANIYKNKKYLNVAKQIYI